MAYAAKGKSRTEFHYFNLVNDTRKSFDFSFYKNSVLWRKNSINFQRDNIDFLSCCFFSVC